MNWETLQENYFFMFLFLTMIFIGSFVVGILLGYVWTRLCQLGRVATKQRKKLNSGIHTQVSLQPRRQRAGEVKSRVSGTWKNIPNQCVHRHSA